VPDSLGGEKLEKDPWVIKPGGKPSGSPVPSPAFARETSLNPLMLLAVAGSATRSSSRAKKLDETYEVLYIQRRR
jgi:hypothetical protein